MKLNDLLGEEGGGVLATLDITGLASDSRRVAPGFLFAALQGSAADGRAFIADAVRRGAVAILAGDDVAIDGGMLGSARLLTDSNPRLCYARMAARFAGPQPATVTAVTGTNGKTSVCAFARQMWGRLGRDGASMGTLGVTAPGFVLPGGLTTPEPVALHETLAELARRGVTHVAMEASSHGLDQYRLDGVRLAAAAFTNLTHDHLDYHVTMEAYLAAKRRLFAELLPEGATAVLNADDPAHGALAEACAAAGVRAWGYGTGGQDLRIVSIASTAVGQNLTVRVLGREYRVELPLAGRFQAMNALCALGLVLATGADTDAAVDALGALEGVPGRLERVARRSNGAPVYVDYAHTPDALETVLRALRPHARGRLVVVFGCGGDRDRTKRGPMGALADRLADRVIVTDDNPRSEIPAEIRRAILSRCPKAREIGDRYGAIHAAVGELEADDLLVIAGKGHERGQIVGDATLPFDDAEAARRAVAEHDGEPRP